MGLKAGWLAMFVFVWVIGMFLGVTFDGYSSEAAWGGTGTGGYEESPQSTLSDLMYAVQAIQRNPIVGTITVVTNGRMWTAAFKIVTWQFSFAQDIPLFYWVFLFPFVVMGFLSILLLVYGIVTGNLEL